MEEQMDMNMDMDNMEEQMLLLSELYSEYCTSQIPPQAEEKVRRRRKGKGKGKGEGKSEKRRMLSDEQVKFLEMHFERERKIKSGRKVHLATELGLDPKQVTVWFQNRRARWRKEQLEEEYSKLKAEKEAIVLDKCHLQAQILKLEQQLSEAEKEIRRLSGQSDGDGSLSSSMATHHPLMGEDHHTVHQNEALLYVHENNYIHTMEWLNSYGF